MLLAGVYRPVPLMTTLCMVVSLICSGRKRWYRRTNTQGVFSHPGEADLAALYSDPPLAIEAQNHGTGIYRREVCHKRWRLAHSPLLPTHNPVRASLLAIEVARSEERRVGK